MLSESRTLRFSTWSSRSSRSAVKLVSPPGGAFSPLAANIYLNELDWYFEAIRGKTTEGSYEAVNYHRFADGTPVQA